jgi:hypothetical protein
MPLSVLADAAFTIEVTQTPGTASWAKVRRQDGVGDLPR